jgi:hypothetical protein
MNDYSAYKGKSNTADKNVDLHEPYATCGI